jgi:1-acyl-sn-glycerol-3-phosphate acyltransferase
VYGSAGREFTASRAVQTPESPARRAKPREVRGFGGARREPPGPPESRFPRAGPRWDAAFGCYRPPVFRALRAAFNSLLLPVWTVICVSGGVCAVLVTRDRQLFCRWQKHWAKGLFHLCGIELTQSGRHHMQPATPYVIVANHASYMDIPALFAALPIAPQMIAKRELLRIPFLGTALRWGGHVIIERGNRSSARDSLEQAAAHVRRGATVLLFPEGTRAVKDEVGPFKTGAFRLAKAGGAAILPVGISGTRAVLPKHGRLLRPGRLRVQIGEPISVAEVASLDVKALSHEARARVAELSGYPGASSSS